MRPHRMSWSWWCLCLWVPQVALATPEAVLVVEEAVGLEGLTSPGVLDQMHRLVSRRWRVRSFDSLPGLLEREPGCLPNARREQAQRIRREIELAVRAFYQQIDPDEARERLGRILDEVRALPCVVPEDPVWQVLDEAALLQVRLLLMEGRPVAATEVARHLLQWQEFSRLPLEQVPPEVRDFLGQSARDREASLVSLEVKGLPEGWHLLVDGNRVLGGRKVVLMRGRHRVDLLGPGEAFRGFMEAADGASWAFQVDLSRVYRPGPGPTLWASSESGAWGDRRIAETYGLDVLRLRTEAAAGTCRVEVTASAGGLPRQEVLWVDLRQLPNRQVQVVRKGVLVQRVPWYWAPVSGALSLGLILSGVVLNLQANRTMDAIVGGEDRIGTWRSQRQGAIASYALGAALGVTAAALTWASHGMPARSSVLVPEPTGTGGPSASLSAPNQGAAVSGEPVRDLRGIR